MHNQAPSLAEPNHLFLHELFRPVGETLYLTPYIEAGDIENARELARVVDPLPGVDTDAPESYSGYLTVNDATNSNMFFWFFPAAVGS